MHGAVLRMVLVAAGYVELGPRLKRSNLEYVILQGSQFHRTKWLRILQRCSRRLDLVPRWAGQRLSFASDDFFLYGIIAAPRTQLPRARALLD